MKQQDIKVDKLRYDPFDPNVVEKLEEEYGKFDFGVDKKRAAKYLILFYDLNTPLIQRYPDSIERRLKCADICEFPKKDGVYEKRYEDLMIGDNIAFNDISYSYMRSFGSPELIALHIFWKYYGEQYKTSSKTFDQKEYKDSINNVKSLLIDIKKLEKELFSGEESLNMRMALYKGIEKEIKLPTPENIANAENVDDLLHNPYGDNYKPDELHYKGAK